MKRLALALILVFIASSTFAGPMFFTSEAAFDAEILLQSLGLTGTEDWEGAVGLPSGGTTIDDSIMPGVASSPAILPTGTNVGTSMTVQSNTGGNPGGTLPRGVDSLFLGDTTLGHPSNQLSTTFGSDSLDLLFGPGVMGISFTPLFFDISDFSLTGTIDIEVFDTFNVSLGVTTLLGVDNLTENSFFGVVAMAGQPIGRINVDDGNPITSITQGVDNIDVYQPSATTTIPPQPGPGQPGPGSPGPGVPEPGTLTLLALGLAAASRLRRS